MVEIKIHLYQFAELSDTAKVKAIMDHRVFMINTLEPDYIDGVTDWNDPEKMQMYYDELDYLNENDEPIVESIEANEYLFFNNGALAHTQTYFPDGKNPQTIAIEHILFCNIMILHTFHLLHTFTFCNFCHFCIIQTCISMNT